MELYVGLFLITFGIAYLVMMAINRHSTVNVVNEKVTGSLQAQLKSHRRKRKTLGGSPTAGSRFKRTDKTMIMARGTAALNGTSALNTGIIRKPWGW